MGHPLSEEIDLRPTWAHFRLKGDRPLVRVELGARARQRHASLLIGAAIVLLALWAVWPSAPKPRLPMRALPPAAAHAAPSPEAVPLPTASAPRRESASLTETVAAFNKKLVVTRKDSPLLKSKKSRARRR